MEAFLAPEFLRMAERLVVVLGGILAIVLGYRLFAKADIPHDADGTLKTIALEVGFNRVGPGVFFAVVGAAVLAYSLASPISVSSKHASSSGGVIEKSSRLDGTLGAGRLTAEEIAELRSLLGKLPEADRDRGESLLFRLSLPAQDSIPPNFIGNRDVPTGIELWPGIPASPLPERDRTG